MLTLACIIGTIAVQLWMILDMRRELRRKPPEDDGVL